MSASGAARDEGPPPADQAARPQATGGNPDSPRHIAIIMDGNGRWAEKRGQPRVAGHRAGAEALRSVLRAAGEAGVEMLTVYAFSSENWRRSDEEISDLKGLMRFYLERELANFDKEGIRLRIIGKPEAFGAELAGRIEKAVEKTAHNDKLTLVIALNYGSQDEIADAARALAAKAVAGELAVEDVDADALGAAMQSADLPPLDLLIRTSGEIRLSNFLLWQAAYAELLFVETLWPDFDGDQLRQAIATFSGRQRRYGGR